MHCHFGLQQRDVLLLFCIIGALSVMVTSSPLRRRTTRGTTSQLTAPELSNQDHLTRDDSFRDSERLSDLSRLVDPTRPSRSEQTTKARQSVKREQFTNSTHIGACRRKPRRQVLTIPFELFGARCDHVNVHVGACLGGCNSKQPKEAKMNSTTAVPVRWEQDANKVFVYVDSPRRCRCCTPIFKDIKKNMICTDEGTGNTWTGHVKVRVVDSCSCKPCQAEQTLE